MVVSANANAPRFTLLTGNRHWETWGEIALHNLWDWGEKSDAGLEAWCRRPWGASRWSRPGNRLFVHVYLPSRGNFLRTLMLARVQSIDGRISSARLNLVSAGCVQAFSKPPWISAPPFTVQHVVFERDLMEKPEDALCRMAYADWLADRGEWPERVETLRAESEALLESVQQHETIP